MRVGLGPAYTLRGRTMIVQEELLAINAAAVGLATIDGEPVCIISNAPSFFHEN